MATLSFLLMLASIVFLIIGIFNPAKSLFWYKKERTKKKSAIIYCFGLIVFLIGFGNSGQDVPGKFDCEGYANYSSIISQRIVKANLKSPSTAKFPDDCESEKYIRDSIFVVYGCVDAQNSIGVIIRTNYRCKLQYKGGDWADINSWKIIDFNLDNNQ